MAISKEFKEHAKALGHDPAELLAFYRGLGPSPKKAEAMAEMVEKIAENTGQTKTKKTTKKEN